MQVLPEDVKWQQGTCVTACYDRHNQPCGCVTGLKKAPTECATSGLLVPQCRNHGHNAVAGGSQLCSSLRQEGYDGPILLEFAVRGAQPRVGKSRTKRTAQRARKDTHGNIVKHKGQLNKSKAAGRGGQFPPKGRAGTHYVDIVVRKHSKVVGIELNDPHHDSVPAAKRDNDRMKAAKHCGIKQMHCIRVAAMETDAHWRAAAAQIMKKLT